MSIPKIKVEIKCSHCNGTGMYQRHTSYLIGGEPTCFKCGGPGKKIVEMPLYSKVVLVIDHRKREKLIKFSDKKKYIPFNGEIPF